MAPENTPTASLRRESLEGLAPQGLKPSGDVHWNLVAPELVEAAIRRSEGRLANMGPFVAVTSPHTGRSPNDKFVVQEASSEADVDWGKVNQPMAQAHYEALKDDVKQYLNSLSELFVQDLYCGADPATRLSVRYVLPNAWHTSFVRNMFSRPAVEELAAFAPNFTVFHAPEYQADPARHGTRTGTFIVLNIAERTILIGGTRYAGELKKAMFTVMNYLLPKQGVLSMHCSANIGADGVNVTIVLLSMNRSNLTIRMIDSVKQYVPHFAGRILIADNGSSPEELAALRQHLQAHCPFPWRILEFGTNFGVAGGRNRAFREVDTDWVMSLDNDIYLVADPFPLIQRDMGLLGCRFLSVPLLNPGLRSFYSFGGHLSTSIQNWEPRLTIDFVLPPGSDVAAAERVAPNGTPFLCSFLFGGA